MWKTQNKMKRCYFFGEFSVSITSELGMFESRRERSIDDSSRVKSCPDVICADVLEGKRVGWPSRHPAAGEVSTGR